MQQQLDELKAILGKVWDLERVAAILEWDQQTYMPPAGAPARADQMATLQETSHRLFVSDEVGLLLERLQPLVAAYPYESDEASLVRVAAREYGKRRKLPAALVAERARLVALAHTAWEHAREQADFAFFEPHLSRLVEISIQIAEALGYQEHIYDALLDLFEPETKSATVAAIFDEIKTATIPLVRAISDRADAVDDAVLAGDWDPDLQWELGKQVLARIGFDWARGRQDRSVHPFTTSFSPDDVRLTTRINPHLLTTALFGTIHEGGHALYEQGLPGALARTPLCDGSSMAVHESQSRMWENVVGRSQAFWRAMFPHVQALFPDPFAAVTEGQFYRAINRVRPGLVRVEADEVTYNLHIFMRFELEMALLEGSLRVHDLPEAWAEKTRSYLGLVPPDDRVGVLQDVHWSGALFGYFPTYALGNLLAVQFYNQAVRDNPDIPAHIASGEFAPLLSWMREHIHRHGARFTPQELVLQATGEGISARPFIDYVRTKYGALYDL